MELIHLAFTWKPDIPGEYTVIAPFAGSESYYSSYGEAFFTASDIAPTLATQAPAQSAADMYFVPATVGIAAIIVGFALLAVLALRSDHK